jgi:hypothetical protein
MKQLVKMLVIVSFLSMNINLYAQINITSNTKWSSLSPAPTSSDDIIVSKDSKLIVDVSNGVCTSLQIGLKNGPTHGNGFVIFNSGCQLTVIGNVTLGNYPNNGSIDMTSGGTLKIGGSFTAPTIGTFTAGSGTIEYNGTSSQIVLFYISLLNQATAYYNLTINNSAGVTLGGSVNVAGTLTMIAGNIITGSNVITLGTSALVRGTLNYSSGVIITGSTGGFKRWFANSTVSNVLFPVGTLSTINMITLSFTTGPSAGSLTAFFELSNPGTNSLTSLTDAGGYSIDTYSQRGYWQITAADGLSGGIYNITLRGQGFNPFGTEITKFQHLRILKRTGPGINWSLDGTHLDAFQFGNSDPVINRNSINTGFNQFAMGGNIADGNPLQGPLPVELISFTSNIINRDVNLNWVTAAELNNSGFEIQRQYLISSGNKYSEWEKIAFVKGQGTISTPTNYSFNDTKLNVGNYKYRLKQNDYNGNFEYYLLNGAVEITVPKKFELSQNYPNPFNPVSKIDYNLPSDSKVKILIYDITGKEMKTLVNEVQTAGYYTVIFNGVNLASGLYFYRIFANANGKDFIMVKKMMLIK